MLFMVACAEPALTESTVTSEVNNNVRKTVINVNGLSVFTFLTEPATGTNGFLNASRDEIANTSAMDFSYAALSTTNPDIVIQYQGAGAIPNSALVFTNDGATLDVTTSFEVVRCETSLSTGEFVCVPTPALTFDLTWSENGFMSVSEKIKRKTVMGPVTTKEKGQFEQRSATVDGTFGGRTSDGIQGELRDTQSTTITREITRRLVP